MSHGQHIGVLDLADVLDLIYYWLIKDASTDQRADLDSRLFRPPPGEELSPDLLEGTVWSRESEMGAFTALSAAAVQAEPPPQPDQDVL